MRDNTWIQELKAGDVVYVQRRGAYGLSEPATVERITTTQVVVSLRGVIDPSVRYERRFSRSNGRSLGDDCWKVLYLIQATPEVEAKHRLHNMNVEARRRLDQLRSRSQHTFTVEEAQDVIDFCITTENRLEARLKEVKA